MQKQAAQMERQIQETRALNESAFNEMKRQGSSIAQSMSETNAVIASLQQNLIEVKSDLSSLQNTQRQQQEELNKLDARLRKVELQMDVHEGWLRHLWGRMTGKGQAKSTE